MMDVTFVLEESGVTATVEVPCEAKVAAAKEVACTALAVSPASVEMRIGTQVLEGTCRLQDTAFGAGVQVVLACPFADIKCPAKYSAEPQATTLMLSRCGTLCVHSNDSGDVGGFDTETFDTVFEFRVYTKVSSAPAISQRKTRCYLTCWNSLIKVALPGGEVLRKVDGLSMAVYARVGVVLSQGENGVSVYDEDLTLLRTLSHEGCRNMALSHCGRWAITSSWEKRIRLWDVNTGEAVVCMPAGRCWEVALSSSASVFAVEGVGSTVRLFDWSGAALRSVAIRGDVGGMQFTPCGKYLVVSVAVSEFTEDDPDGYCDGHKLYLHQYDVATMSIVRVIPQPIYGSFAISPCSLIVMVMQPDGVIATRHLYPHNSE